MHHSDAAPLRRAGIVTRERILGAVERESSERRRGDPAQDSHKRRLTSPVAADEADHVGGGNGKVYVRHGERRSERLGNPLQFNEMSWRLDWVRSDKSLGERAPI